MPVEFDILIKTMPVEFDILIKTMPVEFDILIKTMPVCACLRTLSKLDTHKQHPVSERNFTKKNINVRTTIGEKNVEDGRFLNEF
jgi:hypothetical protein